MQTTRNIHSYPDTMGRGPRCPIRVPLSIALLSAGFAGMSLLPASAQVAAATPQTSAPSPDAIKQREQELEATRAQQKTAAEAQEKLQAEIAAIGQDRSKLNQQLIDIAAERDQLAVDRDKLKDDQTRLAALTDERQRQQSSIEKDMQAEGARAIALSKQVDSLQGLIGKMEQDLKSAAKAAAAASLQGAPVTVNGKPNLGALKDPARQSPALAFASAKGLFALPVNGVKIRDFGGSDGVGGVEKGISLATRPGAQVTTPCDGWVVYAGPFRSYGQLFIPNTGCA